MKGGHGQFKGNLPAVTEKGMTNHSQRSM